MLRVLGAGVLYKPDVSYQLCHHAHASHWSYPKPQNPKSWGGVDWVREGLHLPGAGVLFLRWIRCTAASFLRCSFARGVS